jgi:hypothetical protein
MTTNNDLELWAHSVERVYRAALRDPRTREVGAFVIFVREGAVWPEYAPARSAPKGAYVVERWERVKRKWVLRDG